MPIKADNPEQYVNEVPEERQLAFNKLREVIKTNMSAELEECMSYGMLGYVVPKSVYPAGYHCNTDLPLPFVSLASQKNFIAFYHMGLYVDEGLMAWFQEEYKKRCKYRLDMGKSCVRFKKMDDIPTELVGELMTKMGATDWIALYERVLKK